MSLENYVKEILENGAVENAEEEFDLDAICADLQEAGFYGSDIAEGKEPSDELFWESVQKHAK